MADRYHRIEAYLDRLFGYALSLTDDPDEARDLVQTCALKALAARRAPADEPAYRAWLFRILRNAFVDQRRRPVLPDSTVWEPLAVDWAALHRQEQALLSNITVTMALRRLSTDHREILALIDIAGFSYAEAAAHLALPAGTVMSRVSRARQALLNVLTETKVRSVTPMRKRR